MVGISKNIEFPIRVLSVFKSYPEWHYPIKDVPREECRDRIVAAPRTEVVEECSQTVEEQCEPGSPAEGNHEEPENHEEELQNYLDTRLDTAPSNVQIKVVNMHKKV